MKRAYAQYSATPIEFAHERNDCAVRALRVATGRTYEEVHRLLKAYGRVDKHGTYNQTVNAAAEKFGMRLADLPGGSHVTYHWPARRHLTLAQFIRCHPVGCYVLRVNRHFTAVIDGVVHDWPVNRHVSPRTRVILAWREQLA